MRHIGSGIINLDLERYLLYAIILSMLTYAVPSLRIGTEEFILPIGGLFIPLSCLLLIIRFFALGKFVLNKVLTQTLFLMYFSIPLSSLFSINLETEKIFKLSVFMMLPILFSSSLSNHKSLKRSLYLIVVVGIVLSVYGFYGYFTGNVGEEAKKVWWEYARYWGIHYLPSTRNSDLYYITIPLIVITVLLFYGNLKSVFLKILLIIMSGMFSTAILLSFSRGAWISIIVTFVVCLFSIYYKKKVSVFNKKDLKVLTSFLCGISLALMASYKILSHFGVRDYFVGKMISIVSPERAGCYLKTSVSNEERIKIVKATIHIIFSHPLGVGPGNLKYFYRQFGLYINHPENAYLHVLAENGLFGFIAFLIFIFYPLGRFYKKIKAGYMDWTRIGMFLTSVYLATSYVFNVGLFNFYNWIVHSIIWTALNTTSGGESD